MSIPERRQSWARGPHLGVAVHAGVGIRDRREARLLDRVVAVPAVDAELPGVEGVTVGNGLNRLVPDVGRLGGGPVPDESDEVERGDAECGSGEDPCLVGPTREDEEAHPEVVGGCGRLYSRSRELPDGNFRERETVTPTANQRRFDAEIRGTVRKTHALTEARAHQSHTARLGAASSRGNAASAVVSGGPCARTCFSASDAAAYALPQAKCKWFVLRQPQRMDIIAKLSARCPSPGAIPRDRSP